MSFAGGRVGVAGGTRVRDGLTPGVMDGSVLPGVAVTVGAGVCAGRVRVAPGQVDGRV